MKKKASFLGLVVGGISLCIFLWYFFDWEEAKLILAQVRIALIGLATFSFITAYCIRALKWTYILRCQENISWGNGYHATMVSSLANFLLPARFGEILRLFIAKKTSHISYASSTAAALVDIFSLMFFILFFLFLSPWAGFKLPPWAGRFTHFFLAFSIISIIVFVVGSRSSNFLKRGLKHFLSSLGLAQVKVDNILKGKIANFLKDTLTQCQVSTFSKLDILVVVLLSVMTICVDAFNFFFLVNAFNLPLTYLQAIMAACFMNVFFFIPSPPGRVGTAEMYPILIFSGVFNLPSNIISAAAVFWHILTTIIIITLGVYSAASIGLKLKTVLNFSADTKDNSMN